MSTTPVIKWEKFETGSFFFFVEMLLGSCLDLYNDFLLYAHFEVSQADVFTTLFIAGVNDENLVSGPL